MRSLLFAGLVGLAGCLLSLGTPAVAQESDRAEELIRQANELRRQGQDSSAIPLLREAYRTARSPRTAAQLGLAELALGYWVEAEQHLAEALAASRHPWVERNRKVLEGLLEGTRSHLGTLVIEGVPAGAEVRVNNRLVGTLPLPAPVRAAEGETTVEVQAPRHATATRNLSLAGRATVRLTFALMPVAAPVVTAAPVATAKPPVVDRVTASRPPSSPERPTWRRALPWTLVAATGLAAGVAVWQHLEWQGKVADFDAIHACGRTLPDRGGPQCQSLYDSYTGARTRAFIGYGLAGALGVGAALALVLDGGEADSQSHAWGPGPGQIGLSYAGGF